MFSSLSILATLFLLSSPVISKSLHVISREDAIDNEVNYDIELEIEPETDSRVEKSDVKLLLSDDEALNVQRQAVLNKIVDRTIAAIVKNLTEENRGKIQIPDLHYSFSTGSSWWEITGDLNAYDGTFEDLTTLKRTEEAILKKNGKKFTISCGIGVTRAHAEYKSYKLRYGYLSVSGEISGTINGVAISAAASVDYNQAKCQTVLENLRVRNIGEVNIQMTGLGPLNGLLSSLATWIAGKWQDDIVSTLEQKLKQIATSYLHLFDCEKYRP